MKKNIKKIMTNAFICTYLLVSKSFMVFAATGTPGSVDVSDETIVTGTQSLVNWAMNIEMTISGIITAVLVVKEIIKIQAAPEDQDTKIYYKHIRTIVIAGIAAILVGGIIKKIVSFYQ